jgi:hypothetical protein
MAALAQPQQLTLRKSMTMARILERASEWQEGKPQFAPSWNAGNKHIISMKKSKPLALPDDKEPVPTLADLRGRHNDTKVRCYNPYMQEELAMASERPQQPSQQQSLSMASKSMHEASSSMVSRASKTLPGRNQMDASMQSVDVTMMGGAGAAPVSSKLTASRRKKEMMEMRYKEANERRIALLRESVAKKQTQKEEEFV